MSRVVNVSRQKQRMRVKPGVASVASGMGHCSRENPAWLTYTASGSAAVRLKPNTDLFQMDSEVRGTNALSLWILEVDEEMMKPGCWCSAVI